MPNEKIIRVNRGESDPSDVGDVVEMPWHEGCEGRSGKVTIVLNEDVMVADCDSCGYWVYVERRP